MPQFLEFVRSIDSKFEKYDAEGKSGLFSVTLANQLVPRL